MTAQMTWTAEEIVETLYRALLLREPDDDGLRGYVADLLGGAASLEEVISQILGSPEFHARQEDLYRERLCMVDRPRLREHSEFGEVSLLIRDMVNTAARHRILVDAGARGRDRSNSYDLMHLCRWKGLLIEANPALIPTIREDFFGLDFELVECAVSDHVGEGVLHIGASDDVSSLSATIAEHWGQTRGAVTVKIDRLPHILRAYSIPLDFDLLSLDIEGEDIRVMNDVIAAGYKPRWVIIEASFDFATRSLYYRPFSEAVRDLYRISSQTKANLLLRLR
jgi:FkbM family methyltransferase